MATKEEIGLAIQKAYDIGDLESAKILAQAYQDYDDSQLQQPVEAPQQSFLTDEQGQFVDSLKQGATDLIGGAVRGAGSIGSTLMAFNDAAANAVGINNSFIGRKDRREALDSALSNLAGVNIDSGLYKAGKIGAEIAGTAGMGGALSGVLSGVAPAATGIGEALASSGMSGGNLLARAIGGAASGAASAGLVDPNEALTGGVVGGLLPGASQVSKLAGKTLGKAIKGNGISDSTIQLAQKAKELGIDVPADRLANSKVLNAVTSGLNYMPFSGRPATEELMVNQTKTAASKLIGENTDNLALGLRNASERLGGIFDETLKNNNVKVTDNLLTKLGEIEADADSILVGDQLASVKKQIGNILNKGETGEIKGRAAYNIKMLLDKQSNGNDAQASFARDVKGALMDALNESLGAKEAAAFAKTREQYGNMLDLEKIVLNGSEGDISIAKLAGMRKIKNQPMRDLVDITAQFVKPREAPHGSMQRAVAAAAAAGSTAQFPGLIGIGALGRGANMLLNSNIMRNAMLNNSPVRQGLLSPYLYKSLPVMASEALQ